MKKGNDMFTIIQDIQILHIYRYTSSSRDARKMYGDITPGDVTHQDVTLLYQNHFKSAFRNIPKEFPEENKFKIWQMCSDIFRVCHLHYNICNNFCK